MQATTNATRIVFVTHIFCKHGNTIFTVLFFLQIQRHLL